MKVGLQIYSVRDEVTRDPRGALQKVADMGYKYWETCHMPAFPLGQSLGLPAKEAKELLEANGVKIVGAHISSQTDLEALAPVFEYNAELGGARVGLSAHFFHDRDDVLRKCEQYNRTGEFAKKNYGMRFYYHNHFHEFQVMGDKTVMELIAENTDPALVDLQLDTFWAARGGADPVKVIRQYRNRMIMLHQKDFNRDAGEPVNLFEEKVDMHQEIIRDTYLAARRETSFAEVGTGILPIQDYIDAGNAAGIPYILLEQDFTFLNQLESVKISMDSFRRYTGIEWA
jgi:sugar phosphate isomerase/epimerase